MTESIHYLLFTLMTHGSSSQLTCSLPLFDLISVRAIYIAMRSKPKRKQPTTYRGLVAAKSARKRVATS